jgi:hypothetical protein
MAATKTPAARFSTTDTSEDPTTAHRLRAPERLMAAEVMRCATPAFGEVSAERTNSRRLASSASTRAAPKTEDATTLGGPVDVEWFMALLATSDER